MADNQNPILAVANNQTAEQMAPGLVTAAQELSVKTDAAAGRQEANVAKQETVMATITQASKDITNANSIIELNKIMAELNTQNRVIDTYEAAGGQEFNRFLAQQQMAAVADLNQKEQALQDKLSREITGIGFIDGILNEFSAFQDRIVTAQAENRVRQVESAASNLNSYVESTARVAALTERKVNQATMLEIQKKLKAEAEFNLGKLELEALANNSQGINAILQANSKQLEAQIQVYRLKDNEETRQLQRKQQELQLKDLDQRVAEWIEMRPMRQAQMRGTIAQTDEFIRKTEQLKTTEKLIIDYVQRSEAASNLPISSPELILEEFGKNTELGAKYKTLLTMGASGLGFAGNNPGEAFSNYSKIYTSGAPDTPQVQILSDIKTSLDSKLAKTDTKVKTEADYISKLNVEAEAMDKAQRERIESGDTSNWFHAAPFSTLSQHSPAIQNSALYQKVLKQYNIQETNPKLLWNYAVAGMKAGVVTPEEVGAGISTIFKVAGAFNTESKRFETIGLKPQTTYNVPAKELFTDKYAPLVIPGLPTAGLQLAISKQKQGTVDLANPTEVIAAAIKAMSAPTSILNSLTSETK